MNVILLDNVENLGSIGDLVKVKPGYGRNFLIPQGKAALATPENIKAMEARRAELEKAAAEELAKAKERSKAFENLEIADRSEIFHCFQKNYVHCPEPLLSSKRRLTLSRASNNPTMASAITA